MPPNKDNGLCTNGWHRWNLTPRPESMHGRATTKEEQYLMLTLCVIFLQVERNTHNHTKRCVGRYCRRRLPVVRFSCHLSTTLLPILTTLPPVCLRCHRIDSLCNVDLAGKHKTHIARLQEETNRSPSEDTEPLKSPHERIRIHSQTEACEPHNSAVEDAVALTTLNYEKKLSEQRSPITALENKLKGMEETDTALKMEE